MARKKDPDHGNVINLEEERAKKENGNLYLGNGKTIYEKEPVIGINNGLNLDNPFGE